MRDLVVFLAVIWAAGQLINAIEAAAEALIGEGR